MTKNKKVDLDKLIKETYTGTQVGFLIENFEYKLGLAVESIDGKFDTVNKKIDSIVKTQDSLIERIDGVEFKIDTMESKIDGVELRLDRMESKLDATFEAVGDIKTELVAMKDKDEKLDRRVTILEKRAVI